MSVDDAVVLFLLILVAAGASLTLLLFASDFFAETNKRMKKIEILLNDNNELLKFILEKLR